MTHKFRFIGLPFYLLDDFGRHTSNDRLARSHVIPKLLYSHIANNTLLVTFHPLLQVILRSAVQQFTFFPVNICFQFYIRCKSTNNILNSYYIYSWFIYQFRKKSLVRFSVCSRGTCSRGLSPCDTLRRWMLPMNTDSCRN